MTQQQNKINTARQDQFLVEGVSYGERFHAGVLTCECATAGWKITGGLTDTHVSCRDAWLTYQASQPSPAD